MDKCPACKSSNIKKASLVADAGTSVGSTTGVGVGLDGSMGIGGARTRSKTKLAEKASYKDPEGSFFGCLGVFLGLLVGLVVGTWIGVETGHTWMGLVSGIIIAVILVNLAGASDQKKSDEARAKYKKTWICMDCGHQFVRR